MRVLSPTLLLASLLLLAACGDDGPKPDKDFTLTLRYCSAGSALSACSATNQNGLGDVTESQRAVLEQAADQIERVVTAGLVPGKTRGSGGPLTCWKDTQKSVGVVLDETVHGLLVLVMVEDLGNTGVLAASGPCMVRGSNGLPLVAVMRINGTGASNIHTLEDEGRLYDVALHELLHTLGFGTLWGEEDKDLLNDSLADPRYLGPRALSQARTLNGAPASGAGAWTSVPVEGGGSTGTTRSHWRQTVFSQPSGPWELMTGYIAPQGVASALSATTLGAIRDLGYSVDYAQAGDFIIPNADLPVSMATLRAPVEGELALGDDTLHLPISRTDD